MSGRTIVVEGPDGNTVSYETLTETREAIEDEVLRYFPQAQDWQLAIVSGWEADTGHSSPDRLRRHQIIMISIAVFALICLIFVASMLSPIFLPAP